ncbi:hypothetical protein [Streptomyces sp. 8N616]|uniref:hypothetical protein n=1 Tax=Streptomyces sp. 8N616 TaxID=3457414 RepID=UPI003FD68440
MPNSTVHFGNPGRLNSRALTITLDHSATRPLLRNVRIAGMVPPMLEGWGSSEAYLQLLNSSVPFVILDVPHPRWLPDLGRRTSVLSRLSPVIALVPSGADVLGLLRAGAANVLERNMPIRELTARLTAEQRWFTATPADPSPDPPGPPACAGPLHSAAGPLHSTQRLLLRLLVRDRRPWCCHDLRLLLGTSDQPLRRPTLRARLVRLEPYLARMGLTLRRSGSWGRITYQAAEAVPSPRPCGQRRA